VKETRQQIIAVCGIDCTACTIRIASLGDTEAVEELVVWWKKEGWLKEDEGMPELLKQSPFCQHCRGDRSMHWSANCWILKCCVDDKGLEYCYECEQFPCERLNKWAQGNSDYTQALERLHQMKERMVK